MFKKYIEYIKYNPEGYWFKRKLYGWGWTPAKWQGWVIIAVFVAFIFFQAVMFDAGSQTKNDEIVFFTSIGLAVALLIYICYKTGESPKWMWGPK